MMPIMSKPPILTPSQPIQIPKHSQLPRSSLPSSTPENIRKRRHRDVEMISQPSSQSGSPNNSIILNNNNNNLINDKFSRSRAFTCPETMKQQQQQQPSVKEQSVHPSSPDKIAKFDPSCPLRHHPDNLSPPNTQAMMLEQLTTAYILNALGESAYRTSDPTTITKDENKSKQLDNGMQLKTNTTKEINEKSGSIVKIPMSEIHRMIEDCYNDL
uniref:Uncharacterized protein n=1 Tax=Panagrolaimus sp. ES5 TaxID=591445 RepID=A0AC34EZY1_9BILA